MVRLRPASVFAALAYLALATPTGIQAQEGAESDLRTPPFTLGASIGGTYYCILSRCNTGTALGLTAGYSFTEVIGVEASGQLHRCLDCDRFLIGEGSLVLTYPGDRAAPFLSLGGGVVSDSGLLDGTEGAVHLGVGIWIRPGLRWSARVEARGREVGIGSGDRMGEVRFTLTRR